MEGVGGWFLGPLILPFIWAPNLELVINNDI